MLSDISKRCFIPLATFFNLALAAYGAAGLVINSIKLQQSQDFHGQWPLNPKSGIILLMGCQAGFIIAAIPGLIGMLRKSLIVFFAPAFIYLGIVLTTLILGLITLTDSSKDFTPQIIESMKAEPDGGLNWITRIQSGKDCCGVKSWMDYNQMNFSKLDQYSVPYSCCIHNKEQAVKVNCGLGVIKPTKNRTEIEKVIYANGCNRLINKSQNRKLTSLGAEMIMIGILTGFVTVYLYLGIISLMQQETEEMYRNLAEQNAEECNGTGESGISSATGSLISFNSVQQLTITTKEQDGLKKGNLRSNKRGKNKRSSYVSFADDLRNNNNPVLGGGNQRMKNQSMKSTFKSKTLGSSFRTKGYVSNPPRQQSNMQLLFKPKQHSMFLASASPCPSSSLPQDFLQQFRQHQLQMNQKRPPHIPTSSRVSTNDSQNPNFLSHYSSLPHLKQGFDNQVQASSSTVPDSKAKAMAELKSKFPTYKNITDLLAPSPNQLAKLTIASPKTNLYKRIYSPSTLYQTQHQHYIRTPFQPTVTKITIEDLSNALKSCNKPQAIDQEESQKPLELDTFVKLESASACKDENSMVIVDLMIEPKIESEHIELILPVHHVQVESQENAIGGGSGLLLDEPTKETFMDESNEKKVEISDPVAELESMEIENNYFE